MRPPAAERSLRHLVSRLAGAQPEDVAQVLEALDPVQQDEVRALLEAYGATLSPAAPPRREASAPIDDSPQVPSPTPPPAPEVLPVAGLSSWLAQRVAAAEGGAGGDPGRMTPAARSALAEVARALPVPAAPGPDAGAPRRRGLNPFRRAGASRWA
jgi:hypothetical protein